MSYICPGSSQLIDSIDQFLGLLNKDMDNEEPEKRIIIAARQLFYKKGYDGTRMRDIAATAGVNLAMLHYYYRAKEAIFMIVFEEAFGLLFKRIDKALAADCGFFGKIRQMVYSYADMASENPELPMFVMHEASKNPELVPAMMEKHKVRHPTSVDLSPFFREVNKAIEEKIIKPIDPRLFFMDILSLSVLPYLSIGVLEPLFNGREEINNILSCRKEHFADMLISAVKA